MNIELFRQFLFTIFVKINLTSRMLGELSLKINTVGIGYSIAEFFCSVRHLYIYSQVFLKSNSLRFQRD